jgi:DNA invertase Pin-like site-specific DNA recombinase
MNDNITTDNRMKVIAYFRVSTGMQIESGAGMSSQEDICSAWTKKHGLEISQSFVEKPMSGAAPLDKRPALFNAISSLKEGDILLVARLDRLSRDLYGGILIEEAVAHQKARIVSAAGEGTESDDPGAKMIREIIRVVAGFERNITQFRIKAALAAKKARGERAGSLPFGLMVGSDKKLIPNPAEQPQVEKMIELRKAGYSLKQTAEELNSLGLLNRKNRNWQHDSLWRALKQTPIGTRHATRRSWS